jgi:hypothetical protein
MGLGARAPQMKLTFLSLLFSHSNEAGNYRDQTCTMGASFNYTGGPRMCFNAHKHWTLGWYSNQQIQINPTNKPFKGRLLAFTDARGLNGNDVVIIHFADIYIQYNRAKSFNRQVLEKGDEVVITRANADSTSESIAGVKVGSVSLYGLYKVEFCSEGTDSASRDYAVVQISVIADNLSCVSSSLGFSSVVRSNLSRRPTRKPSRRPTRKPSRRPTRKPSRRPTQTTFRFPT